MLYVRAWATDTCLILWCVQYPAGNGMPVGAWCCGTQPPCSTCFFTNAGLPVMKAGVECYRSLGVLPSKLVLLVPWYAYDYTCRAGDTPGSGCHVTGKISVCLSVCLSLFVSISLSLSLSLSL